MSIRPVFIMSLVVIGYIGVLWGKAEQPETERRSEAKKQFDAGNYNDSYKIYRDLAIDPESDSLQVGGDLNMARQCLYNLGRPDEVDNFREEAIVVHAKNWRLLQTAAQSYIDEQHFGYIIAGEFYRGNRRGDGRFVSSLDRDRVRALQLMQQASQLLAGEPNRDAVASFYLDDARMWMQGREYGNAWKLQTLTDLATLPDYEESPQYFMYGRRGYGGWGGGDTQRGAPVDAEGNPVFYSVPETYEAATNDGERWRWFLSRAEQVQPNLKPRVTLTIADFLWTQFGVQTMAQFGYVPPAGPVDEDDDIHEKTGPYALHTLEDDETIARLATGITRFTLPKEFSFVAMYQEVASGDKGSYAQQALEKLAQVFEDRRQYPRAADYWKKCIADYGPGNNNYREQRLQQIIGNWGRFEPGQMQTAGEGGIVNYRYRNGEKVTFEAFPIDIDKLLSDVKAYIKSRPKQLDWQRFNLDDLGYRFVQENQQQYVGERVAQWQLELDPPADHFDDQMTVTTPLQKAGAYLVTAQLEGGNISRIIVWLTDTVILKKQLDNGVYYFIGDAETGRPVSDANIEFFGYQQKHIKDNNYDIITSNFSESTDDDGQVFPDPKLLQQNFAWLTIARTKQGRLAYMGFRGVWYGRYHDPDYLQHKVFVMTDRPVYRPSQPVKFKFWINTARYDQEGPSPFAGKEFPIVVTNPQGEKIFEQTLKADDFGGFDDEFTLGEETMLGQYSIHLNPEMPVYHPLVAGQNVPVNGGGSFRVEEYKKPEYEVKIDAPSEPVMLGEKITATINAKYYFGAPVTNAKVKFKVQRTSYDSRWYPAGRWDWLYGSGYWWFSPDYAWYPGWHRWGCVRPIPPWWGQSHAPPELVLDEEVEIGPDGTVNIEIDTLPAKELHGDTSHKYEITAEVVDESRRTIVGTGQVLVAKEPFKVFTWLDRGHYQVGSNIQASFKAQTLDEKPVQGTGKLTLYRITYDEKAEPIETAVEEWNVDTNERGEASQKLTASEAGQYRLSYQVTDAAGHMQEGGYLFVITGEGFDGHNFRFNDIELITEKKEYEPGETVRVLINTNRAGSTVLLFTRPTSGLYLKPLVLHLDGKSTVHEIAVVKKDMPNFFVEAVTVANASVHSELKEIVVPPEKRIVNVEVKPSAEEYQPGKPANVTVKLTDLMGNPFVGSTVVSIYDKSVEYISGGSNVGDIKKFFWEWRRRHHPQTESNLTHYFYNLLKSGETGMGNLGTFGNLILQEEQLNAANFRGSDRRQNRMRKASSESRMAAGSAAPMAAREMQMADGLAGPPNADKDFSSGKRQGDGDAVGADPVEPTVRKNFADTALWIGSLTTDAEGLATVSLTMPENLTTWKIRTWALGDGARVGEGTSEVVTTKNIIVRLQAPRFFTETDEVVLSANVHNYLDVDKVVEVVLELEGGMLLPDGVELTVQPADATQTVSLTETVTIPAGGEKRIDWRVKAVAVGEAVVRMKALTDLESDATEMTFPVYVHGMLKMESFTGSIRRGKESTSFMLSVPERRRIAETRLEVRYSPTLAGAMVDALPYLVSYPYETTDTTLCRFLPTVITQNILKRMNLDLKAIQEKRTNLNAQEIGDDAERAKQWKQYKDENPVFDEAEVERMVKRGVNDLTNRQLTDGGWGWFSGFGEHSQPHMTAQVVHGLFLAQENGVTLVPDVLQRGVNWLTNYQNAEVQKLKNFPDEKKPFKQFADNLDALVFMVLVESGVNNDEMKEFLYRDRTHLSVSAKGIFGLALHKLDDAEKLDMIVRNIDQFLVQDDENQTAYLKLPGNAFWWFWYDDEVDANSYYLKLLSRTDPQGEKASGLVKYLLNNRKHATYWKSTRDTALAVEALAEFLVASGEAQPDMTLEVVVDGNVVQTVTINSDNLFQFDNKVVLEGEQLTIGEHTVELRRTGEGPLYYNAYLTNFTLEEFITKAGLEIKVQRKFYKLVKDDKAVDVAGTRGQAVSQKVEKYLREEIDNLSTLKSGELVEIELEIDSKNDYEYIVFEDMKAAGFEPVDLRSGYNSNSMGAYMQFRDERVTFFIRRLLRGKHSVSYRMRAEIPGQFSALPTTGFAMYAPELKGNSDEIKLAIED
ncbi:MAG: MG2 domain-containing protein [Planctomycetota bacterium]|nr:MG2 domain-containing protein [Planctomycetota bacterium]MDA1211348.1 MG2 domain-containing protein [Planctomycetota bacterium]